MITSLHNDKVKLVRALARRRARWQERCFILEGARLLAEAAQLEVDLRFVLHTDAATRNVDAAPLIGLLTQRGVPCYPVSDEVMSKCAATVTPAGVLAVAAFPDIPTPQRLTWLLIVDNVRTPGNLGTILRTAAAAGVDQVLLSPGTVDPYNPKAVRGGAGAHFRLATLALSWVEIEERLEGFDIWLAAPQGDLPYTAVNWRRPLALIVGGEAEGASPAALTLANRRVTIPMARDVESLNVAVAAGVLLFEIARQRRDTGRTLQ